MLSGERGFAMPTVQDLMDILESIRDLAQQDRCDEVKEQLQRLREVLRLLLPEYAHVSFDVEEQEEGRPTARVTGRIVLGSGRQARTPPLYPRVASLRT
jgi:hypothetical protein